MDYPYLGGLLTMDTNHLLTGMILQVNQATKGPGVTLTSCHPGFCKIHRLKAT